MISKIRVGSFVQRTCPICKKEIVHLLSNLSVQGKIQRIRLGLKPGDEGVWVTKDGDQIFVHARHVKS